MINWNHLMVAAVLFIAFLFYNEWTRKNKNFLFIRLFASLLAVASLLFMAYPYAAQKNSNPKKIILLTDGFIKDSINNFIQQSNSDISFYTTNPEQLDISVNHPVQSIADWPSFITKHTDDTIYVFGNGLSKEELLLINPNHVFFHTNNVFNGISHVYWKQLLKPGEALIVQGHYENSSNQKIKIILQAFGLNADTVLIDAVSSKDFSLHTIPQHAGRAVYSLIAMAGKDTIEHEPVPVEIQNALPLNLLIISSAPDFENTFLKNHLAQQGYKITISTTVSTNKTNQQFLNTEQQQSVPLTSSYLNKFDVLIADEEALQKIPAAELAAIRSAIADRGIGLLVKFDTEKNSSAFYAKYFPIKKLTDNKQSALQLRTGITDSSNYKIKIKDAASIASAAGTQNLLEDENANVYAAAVVYGSGKIVATSLQNTYSIALAGNKTSYQQLWWLLLNKAAKKNDIDELWEASPFISLMNAPAKLVTESNDEGLSKTILNNSDVYLRQDSLLSFQWFGKYWPTASGWQQMPAINGQASYWYVYKNTDWASLTQFDHLTETKRYVALRPVSFAKESGEHKETASINWPFFLLIAFLGCCIFLWVEQKRG